MTKLTFSKDGRSQDARPLSRIVLFGEGMLEIRGAPGVDAALRYGGDTLNTAIYLCRLGSSCSYVTCLGPDPWSDWMKMDWQREGLDTSFVLTDPARLPGLYAIHTDASGERTFNYWRRDSAARHFFEADGAERALQFMQSADLLYITGITLSLFGAKDRERVLQIALKVRETGGQVVFDPNYRAQGWPSSDEAQRAILDFSRAVTVALPSFDDERLLHGDINAAAMIHRWRRLGINEVVLKCGSDGAFVSFDDVEQHVPPTERPEVTDTTGAGDSFNAAYIVARSRGTDQIRAAGFANTVAGTVVGYSGAIIPKTQMFVDLGLEPQSAEN